MSQGKLYLIPTVIAENQTDVIADQVRSVIKSLDYFLVEDLRTVRRYISSLNLGMTIEELTFEKLDKRTSRERTIELLEPTRSGRDTGLISESGCPGIADPGSLAVQIAHSSNIQVVPLVGPSSIVMTLMASGFNGQQFAFHGYLPIDKKKLEQKIKSLEEESRRKDQTQLFIEAPYRNNQLLEVLIKTAYPETRLCVAKGITSTDEVIKTLPIKNWLSEKIDLHKVPTVFALYAR